MTSFQNHEIVRLVELAQVGDKEAFADLFQLFKQEIYSYLRGLVSDANDVDELHQDTFFRAWEFLPSLEEASKFKWWIYAIAHNVAIDHIRKVAKEKRIRFLLGDQKIFESGPDPEEGLLEKERIRLEKERVRFALEELTTKRRSCLLLQVVGGFSPSEVAEQLGLSKETVYTYTCEARKLFQEAYSRLARQQDATPPAGGRRSDS